MFMSQAPEDLPIPIADKFVPSEIRTTSMILGTIEGGCDAGEAGEYLFTRKECGEFTRPDGTKIANVNPDLVAFTVNSKRDSLLRRYPNLSEVTLRYGGVTEPTLLAAYSLVTKGVEVALQRYDAQKQIYETYYTLPAMPTTGRRTGTTLNLATIERHDFPKEVEHFLFSASQGDPVSPHPKTGQAVVQLDVEHVAWVTGDRVESFLQDNPSLERVDLYYSGLTEVTVTALFDLLQSGVAVDAYRFDSKLGHYVLFSSFEPLLNQEVIASKPSEVLSTVLESYSERDAFLKAHAGLYIVSKEDFINPEVYRISDEGGLGFRRIATPDTTSWHDDGFGYTQEAVRQCEKIGLVTGSSYEGRSSVVQRNFFALAIPTKEVSAMQGRLRFYSTIKPGEKVSSRSISSMTVMVDSATQEPSEQTVPIADPDIWAQCLAIRKEERQKAGLEGWEQLFSADADVVEVKEFNKKQAALIDPPPGYAIAAKRTTTRSNETVVVVRLSEKVRCPKDLMGAVIGRKGATIRKLEEKLAKDRGEKSIKISLQEMKE